jgi:hypothetical protein
MSRITPVRRIKEGAKGSYYEAKVSCGRLKIIITNGEDDYPIRLTTEYTGGGCVGNMEAIRRLTTLLFECNVRADCIIEQLNKVICPSCRSALVRGDKEIALSCAKAIARAIEKHIKGNGETQEKSE